MKDDSAIRIEITIRAAMLAKAVLELLNMSPEIAVLQAADIHRQTVELRQWLEERVRQLRIAQVPR